MHLSASEKAAGIRLPAALRYRSGEFHRTVVVAMIAMRVMKTAVDQVVDVIAMRHPLVPTAGAVDVARFMAAAARRALVRIVCTDLDLVFVDMIAMRMM